MAQLQANPDVSQSTVAEVEGLFAKVKDGSFPKGGLLLGVGADYWTQWIRYSRNSPETLSRLSSLS